MVTSQDTENESNKYGLGIRIPERLHNALAKLQVERKISSGTKPNMGELLEERWFAKTELSDTERQLIDLFRTDSAEGTYNIEPWNMLLGRLGIPRLTYAEPPRKRK